MPKKQGMSRRKFLSVAASVAGYSALGARASEGQQQNLPNVVLILADDMGWTGPACYGSDLHETPNIDRLATEGMRFTNAYTASPVCTPTRASIMTGKHPARLNMTTWSERAIQRRTDKGDRALAPPITESDLALEYVTMAEILQKEGYRTLHVGKWHLGGATHYPETQGFEVNIGGTFWGAPRTYWYPYSGLGRSSAGILEHRYVPHLEFGEKGEYLTDRLTSEAIAAVECVRDEPFFLHMAYHTPHVPIEGKPDRVAHYKAKVREGMNHTNARYAAMVDSLDENVGRILAKLDEWDIADRTVVIFYSDNGGFTKIREGEQVTSNLPLRSGKGSLYEGGIRVPLIVRWPHVALPGGVCAEPVTSTDLLPTLLAGLELEPEYAEKEALDGKSFLGQLKTPGKPLDRDTLYWHYPHYYFNISPVTSPVTALRHKQWKYIEYYEDNRRELYNLADDLGETRDLSDKHPYHVERFHEMLVDWRERVNARLPEPNV